MEALAAGQNLEDPKVKNQIAAQVLPLIEDLPNPLERDTYRQALARMLRVDERALSGAPARGPRVRRKRGETASQGGQESVKVVVAVSSGKKIEEYVIGILFQKPELLYRLDRLLQEYGLAPLGAQDFEYTDHRLLFGLIRESVEQYQTEHHRFVVEALPEPLAARSAELAQHAAEAERREEKLLEELLRGVIKLRRLSAGENLNQLRFLQEEAHRSGDLRASSYMELVLQNTRLLRQLDEAYRKMTQKRLE
jgi:DNA primase